ncbi:uncharacterized protein LOC106179674 isoform X1 [Lingula anatina]|uniref:Uncharacterized protein LOC106179674 isoform X1 n=1 Tax=Lingula anatina TaxID=7574 RepID=A0A1S3K9B7_LINAN|nr:uncharacterized protein LOC106179674 isoform X1 [Lingula anatina]|eukprot:XP_013418856.1 uncharacterized protein LOC106179674 isoform X1 [Lingula anatina]
MPSATRATSKPPTTRAARKPTTSRAARKPTTSTTSDGGCQCSCPADDKVWLFASGEGPNFAEYVEGSVLKGFNVDIVEKVCAIAGKKCKVVLTEYSECVSNQEVITFWSGPAGHDRAGRGLSAGWFDACISWGLTTYRKNILDFTKPFYPSLLGLFVHPDSPDINILHENLIVFVKGWYASPDCLRSQGQTRFGTMWARDAAEARAMVLNRTADGFYYSYNPYDVFTKGLKKLSVASDATRCANGTGILVKKDSPLPIWWNKAFESFQASGGYRALCAKHQVEGRQMYENYTGKTPHIDVCFT